MYFISEETTWKYIIGFLFSHYCCPDCFIEKQGRNKSYLNYYTNFPIFGLEHSLMSAIDVLNGLFVLDNQYFCTCLCLCCVKTNKYIFCVTQYSILIGVFELHLIGIKLENFGFRQIRPK